MIEQDNSPGNTAVLTRDGKPHHDFMEHPTFKTLKKAVDYIDSIHEKEPKNE